MHKFDIARETLEEILDKKVPFNIATKSILDKNSVPQEDRALITGIVGCELRHHLLFKTLIEEDLKEASEVNQTSILLALANHHFYQKFDEQEVIALTFKATKIDKKVLENFLNSHNDKNELIPAKYEKGTFEYLSLRYNCPVWLVKMLIKHYGRGLAFKVLQANTKPVVQSYKVEGIEIGKVLLDNNFAPAPVGGMVVYVGKGTAKNTTFYKNKNLLPEKMAFKATLDKIDFKPASNVAVFSGYNNTMYVDLVKRLSPEIHVDLVTPDMATYNEAKRHISIYGLKNTALYQEKAASLLACISNKVDYFFMLARNSNFDLLRTNADYFLRFDRNEIDTIMNEQRYSLDEAASLLNDNGQLIYMIPTLNKKESKQIITEFLLRYPSFSLLEERQYFPFEDFGSTLYVARMIKKAK